MFTIFKCSATQIAPSPNLTGSQRAPSCGNATRLVFCADPSGLRPAYITRAARQDAKPVVATFEFRLHGIKGRIHVRTLPGRDARGRWDTWGDFYVVVVVSSSLESGSASAFARGGSFVCTEDRHGETEVCVCVCVGGRGLMAFRFWTGRGGLRREKKAATPFTCTSLLGNEALLSTGSSVFSPGLKAKQRKAPEKCAVRLKQH